MTPSRRFYIGDLAREIAARTGADMPVRTLKYLVAQGRVAYTGRNPGPRAHRFWTERDVQRIVREMTSREEPRKKEPDRT